MIIIRIYGLDPYLTGKLSAELTPNLAKLFETDEDEISFIAEDDLYFHKGFDQNSWNAYVEVHVPEKYHEFKVNDAGETVLHGLTRHFHENGMISSECFFRDGKPRPPLQ